MQSFRRGWSRAMAALAASFFVLLTGTTASHAGAPNAYGVLFYHPGATKPYLDIEDGLDSPVWAAVGPRGGLFVADQYKSSVIECPPGQIHPRGVVSDGVSGPDGLAVCSR